MRDTNLSIAEEVEAAIAAGSIEKCSETAERVTALFLASAGSFSDEQVVLFSDVFERLINSIELRALADVSAKIALAELSAQLAPVPRTPAAVVRRLARHEDISVAGPVLSEAPRLTNEDLVEIAHSRSEKHLLAICGRWWLQEIVTDALLARRFPSVSRRLVENPGARVSPAGFGMIVNQAASDPELAVVTGIRADLPADLRTKLLRQATDAVRMRLLARAPAYLFEELRDAITSASANVEREMARPRDFADAKIVVMQLKKDGRLTEATLLRFARQKRYEETIVALAELARTSMEIVRPLMQSVRSEGILVPCKVAGLTWETISAVLDCRFSSGMTAPDELAKLKNHFSDLTPEEARRLLKLWTVRATSISPRLN
jgi:uncharacterized protein (DUF2336 family)